MRDVYITLSGFSGEQVSPLGEVSLLITVGEAPHHRSEQITFLIVRSDSPNNMLLGRTVIIGLGIIPSTMHSVVLYQSEDRPRVIMSEYQDVQRCEYPEQTVIIGRQLPTKAKQELIKLLKENVDVFAWQYSDMTGTPRTLRIGGTNFATKHKLNKNKKVTPVQQKKRRMAPERVATASKEVEELRKARILKEIIYQTWVANTVMVKKTDEAWRMCVDFTDINKACPKDCYSLPEIDWKVDSLSDFKLKCFLDAYKGYYLIQMAREDEHKTAFHALQGVYCYQKMPFGLKNAGATYQRLVDRVFESQTGRNMEAYVDDMVIKSMDETDMMADIRETFERLRKIIMKLNLEKCSFGMEEGQFLGHVVSKQGIRANSTKIQALTSLKRPKTIKEVQSLNGKLAALNRFPSKSVEKSLPFFKTLKGCLDKKDFTWTRETDKTFEEMKRYIKKLPTLVAPEAGENLIVYLAASKECIIVVLMAERGKDQRPIYFVSRLLQGAELNYPIMEKLVLALIHVARRLERYFQAHNITVLTNKPIRLVLSKPEKSGRVARWAIELGEHEIEFNPRNAVKAPILADFLAETKEEDEETDFKEKQQTEQTTKWKLYTDRVSSGDGYGAILTIVSPEGTEFTYALEFEFTATNNKAEYEAVIAGLQFAKEMKIEEITVFVDSQLAANQVNRSYEARHDHITYK
ncbi:reverse transcriptase domain-containing protein [Tanacetum coccineum]